MPAVTPAMPFFAGRVINCACAWPPCCHNEPGSVWKNALRLQGLLETCHAANDKVSFTSNRCLSPRGLSNRSGATDMSRSLVYQVYVDQTDVIKINSPPAPCNLARERKSGKRAGSMIRKGAHDRARGREI